MKNKEQIDSHLKTVSRTSRTGWDAARWIGSQPRLSDSLKAKVCLSISLRTQMSPGHHSNKTKAQGIRKEERKDKKDPGFTGDVFCTFSKSQQFILFYLFPLSYYRSLQPLCLFISVCLSVCQPPGAWQSSTTAACLVTFRGEPTDQKQTQCFVMLKAFPANVISNLPCSMAARTLRFSSVTGAKLTARGRGSTGSQQELIKLLKVVWRRVMFGCSFHTLLQTSERHPGRSLEY